MSTPNSPGGLSTPSVSGSHLHDDQRAGLLAPIGASASRSSTAPRKFGCCRKTAETSSSTSNALGHAGRERQLLDRRAVAGRGGGQRLARVRVQPARDQEAARGRSAASPASRPRRPPTAPSYSVAFDTGRPVSSLIAVWYSNMTCSVPCETSGWYGVYGRQELRAREQRVDQRRHVVVVHAGAEERDLVLGRDVARRQVAQVRVHLLLRLAGRQVDRPVEPDALGDVGEQLVDRRGADRLEHRLAVGVGGGGVATQVRLPSYASRSISSSTSDGSLSRTLTSQPPP